MPKFLSVKNFERYQHYKHRNPPWIKLYYDLLDDDDFISLSIEARHHYMTLLLIAGRKNNLIPHDLIYLKKVMRLDAEPDISELIAKQFLLASGKQSASKRLDKKHENRAQSISSSETETETETETECVLPHRASMTDEEWIASLKQSPAYGHIDFAVEFAKMDEWLGLPKNRHRHRTRRFILNWLNKVERPINGTIVKAETALEKFLRKA